MFEKLTEKELLKILLEVYEKTEGNQYCELRDILKEIEDRLRKLNTDPTLIQQKNTGADQKEKKQEKILQPLL